MSKNRPQSYTSCVKIKQYARHSLSYVDHDLYSTFHPRIIKDGSEASKMRITAIVIT